MTVSEQIIQVIDALCEKFGIAVNWTGENVLPYVETLCGKLITYEIVTSIATMSIMVVLSIVACLVVKKFYPTLVKHYRQERDDNWHEIGWTVASVVTYVALGVLLFATVCVICVQTFDIIECVVFPEKYIFEYISELISNNRG